jgi:hypothetical protein
MNSYKFAIAKTFVVLVLFVGAIVPVSASADYWGDAGYDGGYWGDAGSDSGYWGDAGYDSGYWGDAGYDSGYWGDAGYDGGYYGDVGYDSGYYGYDAGYEGYDAGYYGYDAGYGGYDAGYYGYDAGYDYGSYSGGGSYDWGCGSSCGSYTTPGCTSCGGYSIPRVSQPAYASSYNSNVVTNTNTNVNNITNIDNSIRDSFNNYNSGNTSIVVTNPQTPVYNPPTYHQPAPYCTITHAQYGGYGSGAYLSWTSTNASSAYLSNVGSVAVSGSQTVYAQGYQTYTLTVHGYNGQQATCATTIQGQVYVPPTYNPPYVSLTQIPYTGFDFGPIGNAMYWVSLLGFAAAGAYLMIYYRGGALAFATAMVPARKAYAPIVAPKAPIMIEREALAAAHAEAKVQPIIASLRKAAGTLDTMAIVSSKDGSMPRIVIQRA